MAVAILGVCLGAVLSLVGTARERVMRAERRWARQHNLSNAVEHYLLSGAKAAAPLDLLPPGFSASCRLEAVEGLPEGLPETMDGWLLGRYTVAVYNAGGQLTGVQEVEKLVREDDLY